MDDEYNIYDGGHVQHNCTDINRAQFSYNNAVYLLGAAYMYNYVRLFFSLSLSLCIRRSATNTRLANRPTEATSGSSGSRASSTRPSRPSSPTTSPTRSRARST